VRNEAQVPLILIMVFQQKFVMSEGGAWTMEIGPIRNQNLIFWPLTNVL